MNHEEIKNLLSAYVDGELEPSSKEVVAAHLKVCRPCRDELREITQMVSAVRSLPRVKAPADMADRVRAAVVASGRPEPAAEVSALTWAKRLVPILAAACVLIVVAVGYFRVTREAEIPEPILIEGMPTRPITGTKVAETIEPRRVVHGIAPDFAEQPAKPAGVTAKIRDELAARPVPVPREEAGEDTAVMAEAKQFDYLKAAKAPPVKAMAKRPALAKAEEEAKPVGAEALTITLPSDDPQRDASMVTTVLRAYDAKVWKPQEVVKRKSYRVVAFVHPSKYDECVAAMKRMATSKDKKKEVTDARHLIESRRELARAKRRSHEAMMAIPEAESLKEVQRVKVIIFLERK